MKKLSKKTRKQYKNLLAWEDKQRALWFTVGALLAFLLSVIVL